MGSSVVRLFGLGMAVVVGATVTLEAQSGLLSREEALALAFPDAVYEAERVFLTGDQIERAQGLAGGDPSPALLARYVARRDGRVVGRAYVDTHVVRTKRESLLISIDAEGRVVRIDVTAFLEPPEYMAPERWLAQYHGRPLSDDVALQRAIRPIAGGTLTAHATNAAVRRVLAIDQVLESGRDETRAMRPWEHRLFNATTLLVTATGLAYLYMKYFVRSDDPFAIVNHPWQGPMLSLHVVSAPFLVLLFGMIFRSHTLRKLQSPIPSNRRTGWTSLVSFGSMAISGYLLQVIADPGWIRALVVMHVATSVAFVGGYAVHLVIGWRLAWEATQAPPASRLAAGRRLSG